MLRRMCNLYTSKVTGAEIARAFDAQEPAFDFTGDKDHYPKSMAPVVRDNSDGRVVDLMRWGFPPPAAARAPVTNVRNLASSFWRTALARPDRRCLVPVTKFCEWEGETGSKIKRWFAIPSRPVFAFAGVWRPTETEPAFAFLTCEPNPIVAPIHPKAMPVILHEDDYDGWLSGEFDQACALATPYPSQLMTVS